MERKSILLVDNDPIIRESIRDAFDGHYAVIEASCYSEAVKFSDYRIDLALIDSVLPDSDGFNALKALRNGNPDLPAIIMTACGGERVDAKAIRAEATDYITKPLKLPSLVQRVSEIFKDKTSTCEHEKSEKCVHSKAFLFESMVAYIEKHYSEHMTLDILASKMSMNKYRFCRAFKNRMGQTFISYLNKVRISNANGLLKNADLNITEIAYLVGYKSLVHFARVFKQIHGISPREYRRNFRDTKRESSHRMLKKDSII